jgi:hypothetical protein
MSRFNNGAQRVGSIRWALLTTAGLGLMTAVASRADLPDNVVTLDQVTRGRILVIGSACAGCHSHTKFDPSDAHWLAGYVQGLSVDQPFQIGPFKTYAANLTPDPDTGIGKFTGRQIFNALRYGLDPAETPDMVISSTTPGQGNFPAQPHYLALPMPWPSWRHRPDADLWDMIAYLQHGIKPVSNKVPDNQEPPDHWASAYTPDKIGPYPLPPYPAASEEFKP